MSTNKMKITLNNFHNNKPLVLENISRLNIVLGENGIGKTKLLRNLLMALSMAPFIMPQDIHVDCSPEKDVLKDCYEMYNNTNAMSNWLDDRNVGNRFYNSGHYKEGTFMFIDNFFWNVSFRNIDKLCSDFLQSVSTNDAPIFIASNNSLAITTLLQKIVNTELEKDVNIIAMYRNKDKEINIRNMRTAQEALDNVENYSENDPFKIV